MYTHLFPAVGIGIVGKMNVPIILKHRSLPLFLAGLIGVVHRVERLWKSEHVQMNRQRLDSNASIRQFLRKDFWSKKNVSWSQWWIKWGFELLLLANWWIPGCSFKDHVHRFSYMNGFPKLAAVRWIGPTNVNRSSAVPWRLGGGGEMWVLRVVVVVSPH